jgi:ketosteroid isomerase-like protein
MDELTPRQVVDKYFAALQQQDFAALRPLIHDDVKFRGVMGTTDTAEEYIEGLRQTMKTMTAMDRQMICAEGDNVCQIYHLVLSEPAVTIPVAQWFTVRAGRIATNQTIFDPRPLLG